MLTKHGGMLAVAALVAALGMGGWAAWGQTPGATTTAAASEPASKPTVPVNRVDKDWWPGSHQHHVELAQKGNIDLYFEGDSITNGWRSVGKKVWDKEFAGWKPANFGIGGDGTQNVLWRLQNGEFTNVKPKVFVLMIGTNNLLSPDKDIAAGVTAVVREVQKQSPETKILLLGIFPRAEKPDNRIRGKVKAVNEMIAPLDDGKTVKYLDIGEKFLEPDGTLPKSVMPDGVHPTEKGYEIWAEAIRPQLTEWLGEPKAAASAPAKQ